jgi:hypothetical protein
LKASFVQAPQAFDQRSIDYFVVKCDVHGDQTFQKKS